MNGSECAPFQGPFCPHETVRSVFLSCTRRRGTSAGVRDGQAAGRRPFSVSGMCGEFGPCELAGLAVCAGGRENSM